MRKFSTFVFVALLGVLLLPGTAWAVAFGITPSHGPPGTSINASNGIPGSECKGADASVAVTLVPPGGGAAVASTTANPDDTSGIWTTQSSPLVVPMDAAPGDYTVAADCTDQTGDDPTYDPQAFTVDPPTPIRSALPAVVRGTTWFLRGTLSGGPADQPTFNYGDPGDQPLMCDWNGDGTSTAGVQRGNVFYLRNSNDSGVADITIAYGNVGDVAVCGDWDGTADASDAETIGVVRGNQWFLRTTNDPANPATFPAFVYGDVGDQPKVGDWDGNGSATPGIRRGFMWYLHNTNTSGEAEIPPIAFGDPGDIPLIGDWNNDNQETPGVFRGGTWFFRNTLSSGVAQSSIAYGSPGDRPRIWFRP